VDLKDNAQHNPKTHKPHNLDISRQFRVFPPVAGVMAMARAHFAHSNFRFPSQPLIVVGHLTVARQQGAGSSRIINIHEPAPVHLNPIRCSDEI